MNGKKLKQLKVKILHKYILMAWLIMFQLFVNAQRSILFEVGATYFTNNLATKYKKLGDFTGITSNNILEVLIPSTTQEKITIQTNKNLAEFDYYGLSISAPIQITNRWNSMNDFNTYYGLYQGNLANTAISKGNVTLNFNSNNTFTMGKKGVSMELNGFFQSSRKT